jgi:hypothetical protein
MVRRLVRSSKRITEKRITEGTERRREHREKNKI